MSEEPESGVAVEGQAVPDGPGAAAPAAAERRAQPLWTAFLTPLAVIVGAALVAGAILFTDDEAAVPADSGQTAQGAVSGGSSGMSSAATTPTTLLAALKTYAGQLGLDPARFEQCLSDDSRASVINKHLALGNSLGVTGTPTFFVNNKMIVGAQPTAVFVEVVEKELTGSPTSIDQYSDMVKALAQTSPPRFAIINGRVDVSGAAVEGNPNAKVMIAEFSDFQCPFCQRWTQQTLDTVRAKLGNDVALAFMHFPITQIHPNAGYTSFAAICAGEQGKFWKMHDLLFARQQEWQNLPAN